MALWTVLALAVLGGCSDEPRSTPPVAPSRADEPLEEELREQREGTSDPRPVAPPETPAPGAPGAGDARVGAQAGVATEYMRFGSEPTRPTLLEANEDAVVMDVEWETWGAPQARGLGSARVNTCNPTCADGRIELREGARVVLSRVEDGECRGRPGRFYTRARITWPGGLGLPERQAVRLFARCA